MSIREAPTTVGTLLGRLRGMVGHLTRRDRDIVLEAAEAIEELSRRLYEATYPGAPSVQKRAIIDETAPVTDAQVRYVRDRITRKPFVRVLAMNTSRFSDEQTAETDDLTPGTRLDA